MANKKKFLLATYIFILFHTIKDFFQDFLETDFLYFFDANEDLSFSFLSKWGLPHEALAEWGRVALVLSNEAAVWLGIGLLVITPFILKKHLPRLEKLVIAAYIFFFAVLSADLLLDPRLTNPKLFFDKSSRITASQMKSTYQNIIQQFLENINKVK